MVSVIADIDVVINGQVRKAVNVPAKQCVKCREIAVHDMVQERLERYVAGSSSHAVDYAECEAEESAAAQILL